MAPEMLAGAKDAPPSSDMWSFGVMAYELLTGERPFGAAHAVHAFEGRPSALPPLESSAIPPALRLLVTRCLEVDPALRPTAAEVAAAL
jgi:serine/threonine-protein kinase